MQLTSVTQSVVADQEGASPTASAAKALPLVVIVTPVYNGEKYLEATMQCVQRQTYPNLVHLILDNASTDGTAEIIERFRGGRVPLQVERNTAVLKQVDNWNAAMRLVPATAAYVQWLCADDLIRRDAVEKLVAKAETDREISIVGSYDVVLDRIREPILPRGEDVVSGRDWVRAVCLNTFGHFPWQAFFIRWRPELGVCDYFDRKASAFDNDATLKRMSEGRVAFVREPLVYTRHHADTVSSQLNRKRNPEQRFWRWEAVRRYADLAASEGERRRMTRGARKFVTRFQVLYHLIGAHEPARAISARFESDGAPIKRIEQLMAILSYPTDLASSHLRRFLRSSRRLEILTEDAFANW